MKKYIILTMAMFACVGLTFAQDEDGSSESDGEEVGNVRKAGDFTGAILFGRGSYMDSYGSVPNAPYNNTNWTVSGSAPYANTVSGNSNAIGNMVGGEVRYFVTDRIAAKVSGGAILRNTPSLQNVQYFGNDVNSPNATWVPQYGSVVADNRVETNLNIGGEYHFSAKAKRIIPYVGANFNYYYSRRSVYDPSIYYATNTANGSGNPPSVGTGDNSGFPVVIDGATITDQTIVYDVGVRTVEAVGLGFQAVAGVDFYLVDGFYLGFDIKPVSMLYIYNSKRPAPGLELLQAETTTWSFMAQPMFKVGFYISSL